MSRSIYALALCLAGTGALAQGGATPPGPTAPPSATAAPAPSTQGEPQRNSGGAAAGRSPSTAAEDAKAANATRYAECVELWDRGTHMSKRDWSRTCRRIEDRLQNLQVENLDIGSPPAKGRKKEKLPNAG
jgi:hypothetical protein